MTELDLPTLIGFLGFLAGLAGYLWRVQRSISKQFEKLSDALHLEKADRLQQANTFALELERSKDMCKTATSRLDKELGVLQERISQMPTRSDLEEIIRIRLQPLEVDVKELTLQLARLGLLDVKNRILTKCATADGQ